MEGDIYPVGIRGGLEPKALQEHEKEGFGEALPPSNPSTV